MNIPASTDGLFSPLRGAGDVRRFGPLLVLCLLLGAGAPAPLAPPAVAAGAETAPDATVVSWRLGDVWDYAIELDAVVLVEDNPDLVDSWLDILTGTARMEVAEVALHNASGETVPAYRLQVDASAAGDGSFPEPNTGIFASGTLHVTYGESRWVRASDLAIISRTQSMHLMFDAFGVWETNIADFDQIHTYDPPQEVHDFPMRIGESWNTASEHSERYEGGGGPVALPEEETIEEEILVYRVAERAEPPTAFAGCEDSVRIDWNATDGSPLEVHWWCPAVRNDVHWWTDDIAMDGVDGTFRLTGHTPGPAPEIGLALSPDRIGLNTVVDVTADTPVTLWLHGATHGPTADLDLAVGNRMDDTPTAEDWGSHGIVACTGVGSDEMVCEVVTLTLEGSALGALLRVDAFERAPGRMHFSVLAADRLALSLRF